LIGIVIGGSGIVLDSALNYSSSGQGQSLSIISTSIKQGPYIATESVVLSDTGQTSFTSLTLSTSPVSSGANYCYSLLNPASMAVVQSTCPTMAPNPSSVPITTDLAPAGSVLIELVIEGQAFALGTSCTVTVTAPEGAQQLLVVEVLPA
jgi:hypothetical protein